MTVNTEGDTSVLQMFFAHNAWANIKVVEFCERLDEEQLSVSVVGGFGSIRDTLKHIIGSEVSYVERVNGRLPEKPLPRDYFPSFDVLKEAIRWAGEELSVLALATREESRVRQEPPRMPIEYKLAGLMVQAVYHSTEHRAQILTIITQLGLEPPPLSVWQYMEEIGELRDLGKRNR
jgi:uncharacterized damage-inducible protein DinB